MRYEYKYLELHLGALKGAQIHDLQTGEMTRIASITEYGSALVEEFNRLGSERWELVGFAVTPNHVFEYVFKRQMSL